VVRYQEHTALDSFYDTPDAARMGYQGRSPWLVRVRLSVAFDAIERNKTRGKCRLRHYAQV
jgi:hypothetical protein